MGSNLVQVNWEARQKILFTNLNTLRKKEIHTDVILSCQGKSYSAHRLILTMGSGYFTKAFEGLMMSSSPSLVFICGIRHPILEAILNFIYEGKATIKADNIQELSKAGEMLEVPGLMDLGKEYSSLTTSSETTVNETKGTKDTDSTKQSKSPSKEEVTPKSKDSELIAPSKQKNLRINNTNSKKEGSGLTVESLFESDNSDSEKPDLFEGWAEKSKNQVLGGEPSKPLKTSKHTKKASNKGKKKSKRCHICHKRFFKIESLEYHMEEHSYKPKFSCSHCSKTFNIEKNYVTHLSLHGIVKEKKKVAELKENDTDSVPEENVRSTLESPVQKACKRQRTSTADSLNYTIDDILKSVSQSFEKLSDDQQFGITDDSIYENGLGGSANNSLTTDREKENFTSESIGRLKEILNLKNDVESVNTRVCRFCDIEFLSSKTFRKHRATECKILECQYCLQNFDEKTEYDSHIATHRGIIRPYTCTECTFCTDKKWNFEDHMSIHTGIYRFWCLLCDFQAKRLCDLKTHTNERHPEVNVTALEDLLSK